MNSIRCGLILISCSTGFALAQSAYAADGTAAASLDWSQLQVSVTGVDGNVPTVTFSDEYTDLSSSAYVQGEGNEYNTKSIYDWTSTLAANAQATATTFAHASASPLSFSANAQSMEGDNGYSYWDNPSASSSGSRSENFSFDGPGVLTVTVPYTLNITGGETFDYWNSTSASVYASAYFSGSNENGNFNSNSNASFSLSSYYENSPDSQSGTLVLGIFAAGPGSGSLSFNTSASLGSPSIIPEPESYALILAGLGLIGMIVRLRSAGSVA
ncbi:PEP-CTERM protein-sorting domain-containing protein [Nitrosospira multiformis]|uniref:PEP-CTERM protein-sorting domain-containing protein n=1 Tax=Nitrosospira multiformis TaxID=1231 RepID=A0A1H8BJE9_9PROT|nr:PEP-CTERM sorting domain-containing protein [Nitrosospira multiformis]SEM83030.1 PEP-CTERM protein-sorting domain-containing protein [Nitrosospira multiformis]